jgi:hypothetical protein
MQNAQLCRRWLPAVPGLHVSVGASLAPTDATHSAFDCGHMAGKAPTSSPSSWHQVEGLLVGRRRPGVPVPSKDAVVLTGVLSGLRRIHQRIVSLCHQLPTHAARPVSSAGTDIGWSAAMAAGADITVSVVMSWVPCLNLPLPRLGLVLPWPRLACGG